MANSKPMAVYVQKRERLTCDIFEPFTPPTNAERLLAYYRKRAMYETIEPAQVRMRTSCMQKLSSRYENAGGN